MEMTEVDGLNAFLVTHRLVLAPDAFTINSVSALSDV